MICQHWIANDELRLLNVLHWPEEIFPVGTVILLPGFAHSMCDMDYFMSRMARKLVSDGFLVIQAELSGHGDSGGDFDALDLHTMRRDIRHLLDSHAGKHTEKLFCLGRGLSATLLAEVADSEKVNGILGIAPYAVSPTLFDNKVHAHSPETQDAWHIFPGDDYVDELDFDASDKSILRAFGVCPYNLHGMNMNTQLLKDLSEYDPLKVLQSVDSEQCKWLFSNPESPKKAVPIEMNNINNYQEIAPYINTAFPREPKFQNNAIEEASDWLFTKCMID